MIIRSKIFIIDTEATVESSFNGNKFEIDHEDNPEFKVAGNKLLLLGSCLVEQYVLEDIASMIEFNTIYFNPPAEPISTITDQRFLTSIANWKYGNIIDIYIKKSEVDHICRLINKHFGLKTRP